MKYYFCLLFLLFANSNQKCTNIYQVFLASFKDSNGDGVGDLRGLASKLDHFVDLNIDCISITPCFKSANMDAGYDVTDYMDIDPQYGTMEDFNHLMIELERKGLKLIIDLIINHSSDEHIWFKLSVDRIDPFTDYYVWADPKGYDQKGNPIPPNNWQTLFAGSAWTWNDKRQQFFLHQFVFNQPDFKLTNPQVMEEIKKMITFWVDKGVRGIRLDAAQHFVEDALLRDEPQYNPDQKDITWESLIHIYTANVPETYEVIRQIQAFTDTYTKENELDDVIFLAEASTTNITLLMNYYLASAIPYNFRLMYLQKWVHAKQLNDYISDWVENLPEGATSNWMAENPDSRRISNKFGDEYACLITMLMSVLPGMSVFYYGQEIGMKGFSGWNSTFEGQRLPMQWDTTRNAGFSTRQKLGSPINVDYWRVNVESQKNDKSSYYHMFKKLMRLRNLKAFQNSSLNMYVISKWILAIVRESSKINYVTVVNLGSETGVVDLHTNIRNIAKLNVEVGTINSGFKTGCIIDSSEALLVRPISGLVFSWKN